MKYCCLFVYVIIFVPTSQKKTEKSGLNVHQRVELLKRGIQEQISQHKKTQLFELIQPIDAYDDYAYVNDGDQPITPIMNNDERKVSDKFKLRELVTTPTEDDGDDFPSRSSKPALRQEKASKKRQKKKLRSLLSQPLDIFYRRNLFEDPDIEAEWVHCQDLITPFIAGFKKDITKHKLLTLEHHQVYRFLQLIRLNSTGYSKEDIYSILYQISNLQVRLFLWDHRATAALIATVIKKDMPHNFKGIKAGVRDLIEGWHLDISNTTNLLKQSRIFRPPCIKVSELEGSTKKSKVMRYPKITSPKPTCSTTGKDQEC